MDTEERLGKIEDDLKEIKAKKKDTWDKMSAVGSILVPIFIAIVGVYFSYVQSQINTQNKKAEIEINDKNKEAELEISRLNSSVGKNVRTAEMFSKFFNPLFDADAKKRELAAEAIIIGAPEHGPKLMKKFLNQSEKSISTNENIIASLEDQRDLLIRQLFSEIPTERLQAYSQLRDNWGSDEAMIPKLISFAEQNLDSENGIYNTLVLLSHMSRDTIKKKKSEILNFNNEVEKNLKGDKIKNRQSKLVFRLNN